MSSDDFDRRLVFRTELRLLLDELDHSAGRASVRKGACVCVCVCVCGCDCVWMCVCELWRCANEEICLIYIYLIIIIIIIIVIITTLTTTIDQYIALVRSALQRSTTSELRRRARHILHTQLIGECVKIDDRGQQC